MLKKLRYWFSKKFSHISTGDYSLDLEDLGYNYHINGQNGFSLIHLVILNQDFYYLYEHYCSSVGIIESNEDFPPLPDIAKADFELLDDNYKKTALYYAINKNCYESCLLLIVLGAKINSSNFDYLCQALSCEMLNTRTGRTEQKAPNYQIALLLITLGARINPNVINESDKSKIQALLNDDIFNNIQASVCEIIEKSLTHNQVSLCLQYIMSCEKFYSRSQNKWVVVKQSRSGSEFERGSLMINSDSNNSFELTNIKESFQRDLCAQFRAEFCAVLRKTIDISLRARLLLSSKASNFNDQAVEQQIDELCQDSLFDLPDEYKPLVKSFVKSTNEAKSKSRPDSSALSQNVRDIINQSTAQAIFNRSKAKKHISSNISKFLADERFSSVDASNGR